MRLAAIKLPGLLRRRRADAAPLDDVMSEFGDVASEHEALTERMKALEKFIASVPESIERQRTGFGDLIPPPDYAPDAEPGDRRPRRLSRRQRRAKRLRTLSGTLAAAALLAVASCLVYIVFRLATTLGTSAGV